MANPSSSHHRERERERHHHHRTISSTTLLLVLSLILAVLAVMLSLPSNRHHPAAVIPSMAPEPSPTGENSSAFWNYLSPKRSQELVAREHDIAIREAEVAKREAELFSATPTAAPTPNTISACVPCQTIYTAAAPVTETVINEVVHSLGGPRPPVDLRMDDVMAREERVSEREKQVGQREEVIGRRETDASRRENWIMEQLIALGNDPAPVAVETEEFVYDPAKSRKVPPFSR